MSTALSEYDQVLKGFIYKLDTLKLKSEEVENLKEMIEMTKKDVILKLKDCLIRDALMRKNPINMEKICAEITKDLNDKKKRVDPSYVRAVLGPEFKDQSKVREQKPVKPIMVTTAGAMAEPEEEEDSPPPKGESKAERDKRELEAYNKRKYYKGSAKESRKMDRAEKKQEQVQQQRRGPYTGPSIGPKEDRLAEEKNEIISVTLDTDQIDEIVRLRTEHNAMTVRLEIDTGSEQVVGIK